MKNIDWKKQGRGVHCTSFRQLSELMPDLTVIKEEFPENVNSYSWDVKVHPCVPSWHFDNVPRINNLQDFDSVRLDKHMYIWVSGEPVIEFRNGSKTWKVKAQKWRKFSQKGVHRGAISEKSQWQGFIRATSLESIPVNFDPIKLFMRSSKVFQHNPNFIK